MNGPDRPPNEPTRDAVGALMRIVGARPEVDALSKARVERAVRAAWQKNIRQRRLRQWRYALAAGFVSIAAMLGMRHWQASTLPINVAVVVNMQGAASRIDGSTRTLLAVGDRLPEDAVVVTASNGYVALSLERIASVRLDHNTELRLRNERLLELARGAVYLDSGDRAGGVLVKTPLLQASDIGTRFMVRHEAQGVGSVSVRDGEVKVDGDSTHLLNGGEGLLVDADQRLRRIKLASNAPDWDWVREAAVPFAADGRSIEALLNWYALESGLRLVIDSDPQLRQRLRAPLHGDLKGLSAGALLEVASVAANFHWRIDKENRELHVAK